MKYYTNCESCGKRIAENNANCTEEGSSFCNKCTKEMTGECAVCQQQLPFWEMTSTSKGETYCEHCAVAIN